MRHQISMIQIAAFLLLVPSLLLAQVPKDVEAKMTALLKNWKTADVEELSQPEYVEVLSILRKQAVDSSAPAARVLLLNFGDEAITTQWLDMLASKDIRKNSQALREGRLVRNPAQILKLEPLLSLNESADRVVVSDDDVTSPPSVLAAFCIASIIRNNPDFSENMKVWVRGLKSDEGLRTGLREWVAKYRDQLKAGDIKSLKPLTEK